MLLLLLISSVVCFRHFFCGFGFFFSSIGRDYIVSGWVALVAAAASHADSHIYECFIMNFSTSINCSLSGHCCSTFTEFRFFVVLLECHQANEYSNHNKLENLFAQFKFDTYWERHTYILRQIRKSVEDSSRPGQRQSHLMTGRAGQLHCCHYNVLGFRLYFSLFIHFHVRFLLINWFVERPEPLSSWIYQYRLDLFRNHLKIPHRNHFFPLERTAFRPSLPVASTNKNKTKSRSYNKRACWTLRNTWIG